MRRVVVAALLLSAAACTSGGSSTGSGVPTLAEVTTVLVHHGQAVTDHDRGAFLSDVGTGPAAAGLRARQGAEFDNLAKLPITMWSYQVVAADHQKDARAAATKRYGSPALIVQVTLHYALRGVDATATRHDLWWTFVRQQGRVHLVGDRDLRSSGGVSWQGPWDFGPLVVVKGADCLVLGHADHANVLHTIAATVDAAVPDVTAVWGTGWTRDVAVIVPSSTAELTAAVGATSSITADIAAVAISDGKDALTGRAYGQRLIVEPSSLTTLSTIGRKIVYTHEITHIATAAATSDVAPRWLVEGFADYVGNLRSGQSVDTIAAELRADVRAGRVPAALPAAADFDTSATAAQAYEGSWLACRLIAARAGQAGLVHFYRLVGRTPGDAAEATTSALRSVLHERSARFVAQWRAYLRAQLG